jgi:hypothetical protein
MPRSSFLGGPEPRCFLRAGQACYRLALARCSQRPRMPRDGGSVVPGAAQHLVGDFLTDVALSGAATIFSDCGRTSGRVKRSARISCTLVCPSET